jgi:glycosyltransferase involved in cell wall biosynthesis
MARAVTAAFRNPGERRRLGRAGRAFAVKHHNPAATAEQYRAHLRSVMEEKSSHAPMRVALDIRWLEPGNMGGLENVVRSFVRELISLDAFNSYTMILPSRSRYDFDLRGRTNFRVVCEDSVASTMKDLLWRSASALHTALRLDYPRSPEVRALEFLHSLDAQIVYSFPGYIRPEVSHLRHLLMVPDIQHEYMPEFFSEQALRVRQRVYADSIHQADHICAISEYTRQTLIERLSVPPEKVTTVPLAADSMFKPADEPTSDRPILSKYDLPNAPYLFFPGHTWRHKNHLAVVTAMAILRDRFGLSPRLICTGEPREAQAEIEEQIERLRLGGSVRFLGYCPYKDLPALYRNAGCLVFPSLFEGFGLPVLEAMACGCPVVCSGTTSLPEVAGDAALLVDPNDAEAIAGAVYRVLCDDSLREHLVMRGLRRAREYSWRRHTQETVAVLHRLQEHLRGRA